MLKHYLSLLNRGINVLLHEGSRSFWRKSMAYLIGRPTTGGPIDATYYEWIRRNEPTVNDLKEQTVLSRKFNYYPLISILMPVWNTDKKQLCEAIDSICHQSYENWELCIADGSSKKYVRDILHRYKCRDSRIKINFLPKNLGIAANSNAALTLANGDFIALLDHDDELVPFALYEIALAINTSPDIDYIYSDEDKIDINGTRYQPFFKPDWSPDYLLACGYTNHLSVYRRSLIENVGGFRESCNGSQDYDLVLRCTERISASRVKHISKVLYHWRQIPNSTATDPYAKNGIVIKMAIKALNEALHRRGIDGAVENGSWPGSYRIIKKRISTPLISIIIPTKDKVDYLKTCINSIEVITCYPAYEIIIIDNNSTETDTRAYLNGIQHRVISYQHKFNFSIINNIAVQYARGDVLVFLNNDIEVLHSDWIQSMLEHALDKDIGPVGAKLLYPDGTIQHAGVVLGMSPDQKTGVAGHVFSRFPSDDPGYFGAINVVRNCSAITGAAMMIRKDVFNTVGGFDQRLAVCYNDVDLCLRLWNKGYRTVYTPHAVFIHHESVSRGISVDPNEAELMINRWGKRLKNDPFYSPNLNLTTYDCRIRL